MSVAGQKAGMFGLVRALLLGGMVGKVLSIGRELLAAWLFGTGVIAAAFRLAQAAMLIPVHYVVSEALNAGFIPTYSRLLQDSPAKARELLDALRWALLWFSLCAALLLLFGASLWVSLLAPGFSHAAHVMAVDLLRVFALAIPAYVLTGLYASVEMAHGGGQLAASRASIQSIGLIAGSLLAFVLRQPIWIAVGFTCAYASLTFWGKRILMRHDIAVPFRWRLEHGGWSVLCGFGRIMRPLLLIPVLLQIHFSTERIVASLIGDQVVAALDYAKFISETAVLLLAVPFGLAGLAGFAREDEAAFRRKAGSVLLTLILVSLPVSAVVLASAEPILRLLFMRGAFDATSLHTTQLILTGLGFGLWAQVAGYALVKFLNARMRNREAVVIVALALGTNVLFNLLAYRWLGAAALGVGASLYGLLLFGLGVWRLDIAGTLARPLGLLILLAMGYLALVHWLLPGAAIQLVPAMLCALTYWGGALLLIPLLRRQVLEIFEMIRRRA